MRRGDAREPVAAGVAQRDELHRHGPDTAARGSTRLLTPRCRAGDADPDGQAPGVCASVPGHMAMLNPTLPLVAELASRRGWRVSYATHERFSRAVADAGATLVPTQQTCLPVTVHRLQPGPLRRSAPGVRRRRPRRRPAAGGAFPAGPAAGGLLRLGQPDGAGPGRSAGPARRGPRCPTSPATQRFSPFGAFAARWSRGRTSRRSQRARQAMQDYAVEQGLEPQTRPMAGPPASPNIVFVPREFQPAADTFDERFRWPSLAPHRAVARTIPAGSKNSPTDGRCCSSPSGPRSTTAPPSSGCASRRSATARGKVAMAVGDRVDAGEL